MQSTRIKLPQAPRSIAPSTAAVPPFGRYLGAIAEPGLTEWDALSWGRRRLQRKAWLYCGCFTEEVIFGLCIVDAGYAATAFAYVYLRESDIYLEEKAVVPFGMPKSFSGSLDRPWQFQRGKKMWRIQPYAGGWEFSFSGKRLKISGDVEHAFPGLTAIAPASARPFNYTYKLAALPGSAKVTVDGHTKAIDGRSFNLDLTAGYPARRTFWNWATASCQAETGDSLGFNLVAPFNDGLENGLWLNGALVPLPKAVFSYNKRDSLAPWSVKTLDERLQFEFKPFGQRAEFLHLGVVMSRFRQPFGSITGSWCDESGRINFKGVGVVEEHHALW